MTAVSDFIEQSKQADRKASPVHKPLQDLISSFTPEEIQHALAVALEDKFFKDMVHENIETISKDMLTVPQEICMELGQDDGYTDNEVRNYLYNTCKLLPQEITKVRVLQKKTFISIPENRLKDCMQLMKTSPITAKAPKIYLVEDVYRKPDRSQQRRTERRRPSDRFSGSRRRR